LLPENEICEVLMVFMQDIAPQHKAKKAKPALKFFDDSKKYFLDWPTHSTDFHSIENL
jgi:hypothetical protein